VLVLSEVINFLKFHRVVYFVRKWWISQLQRY